MSSDSERHIIWVFPNDGNWYRIELPYSDEYAEELLHGDPRAWHCLLGALGQLVEAGRAGS